MNTPAHAVLNLVALTGRGRPADAWPVLAGALAPDLPMFVFYLWERWILGVPERVIWNERYYAPGWQAFFDLPNALPVIALIALAAWILGSRGLGFVAASMTLHVALDLPLHHDDGHRHLFPLSDWRFSSPVSYWDPAHHGGVVAPLEIAATLAGCAFLRRRLEGRWRRLPDLLAVLYIAYLGFVLVAWL